MNDGDNQNALRLHPIDEPVTSHEDLAKIRQLRVCQPPAAFREICKRVASVADLLGKRSGIGVGVASDELDGSPEIFDGGVCPNYFASHLARRFFTWAWVFTFPRAAASRPL